MDIQLFAGLAEAAGRRTLHLRPEAVPPTVGELERLLRETWPVLAGRTFRLAVNRRYADAAAALADGDEVALIPPVSGG